MKVEPISFGLKAILSDIDIEAIFKDSFIPCEELFPNWGMARVLLRRFMLLVGDWYVSFDKSECIVGLYIMNLYSD